jgi:hypothetical protein
MGEDGGNTSESNNPAERLDQDLGYLKAAVEKLIVAQRAEDLIPSPPDFSGKVFQMMVADLRQVEISCEHELDATQPERTVFWGVYPHKSEAGKELKTCFQVVLDVVDHLEINAYRKVYSAAQVDVVKTTCVECLTKLSQEFPDLTSPPPEQQGNWSHMEHYFVVGAYGMIKDSHKRMVEAPTWRHRLWVQKVRIKYYFIDQFRKIRKQQTPS